MTAHSRAPFNAGIETEIKRKAELRQFVWRNLNELASISPHVKAHRERAHKLPLSCFDVQDSQLCLSD